MNRIVQSGRFQKILVRLIMKSLRKKRHSLVIFGSEKDKIQQEFGSPPTSPQGAKNSEKDNKKQSGKSVSLLPPTPPDSPMHQVPHHLISPRFIKDEAKRKKQKIDRRQTVGEGPSGPSGTSVNILTPPRSRNRKKRLSQVHLHFLNTNCLLSKYSKNYFAKKNFLQKFLSHRSLSVTPFSLKTRVSLFQIF